MLCLTTCIPAVLVVGAPQIDACSVEAARTFVDLLAQGAASEERSRINHDGSTGIPELVVGTTELRPSNCSPTPT